MWTWINVFRQRLLGKNKLFIFHPLQLPVAREDCITHLFNEVAVKSGPWVATFETELPRVLPVKGKEKFSNLELARELRYISSPDCRAIIAISEANRQIQLRLLGHFPSEQAAIVPKLHVFHPPQPVIHEKIYENHSGPLTFTFVGNEFYRKGGAEVVLAFSQLLSEGALSQNDVRVNLIGDTEKAYNVAHGEYQDDAIFRKTIDDRLSGNPVFSHFTSLPNSEVLALIKSSDVGLLPTWQDTYGFSVLEMQACGCPVITTSVRALPEINPENAGWLIHYPLNDMSEMTVASRDEKVELRNTIITQLKSHIMNIIRDRHSIGIRSAVALERIRSEHDPRLFQRQMNNLYQASQIRE